MSFHIGDHGVCDACMSGQMVSSPLKPTGNKVYKPLEVVHIDLMGPLDPPTEDNEKYAIVILDEYSVVVLLKAKAEAVKEVVHILSSWQHIHSKRVQHVRTDDGTEFNGLAKFYRDNGAVHQKPAPYAHQQNRKIELYKTKQGAF